MAAALAAAFEAGASPAVTGGTVSATSGTSWPPPRPPPRTWASGPRPSSPRGWPNSPTRRCARRPRSRPPGRDAPARVTGPSRLGRAARPRGPAARGARPEPAGRCSGGAAGGRSASTSSVDPAGLTVSCGLLPEPLERLAVAERDSGFEARAGPHFGQIEDRVDQLRPAARGNVPGRRVQRGTGGSPAPCAVVTSAAATVWSPSLISMCRLLSDSVMACLQQDGCSRPARRTRPARPRRGLR